VLDEQTALLEYSLGSEPSYLWVVTTTSIALYQLAAGAALEKQITDLRDQIVLVSLHRSLSGLTRGVGGERGLGVSKTPASLPAAPFATAANALYQTAVAPAAAVIANRRLLVVADGALNYVPFEALV